MRNKWSKYRHNVLPDVPSSRCWPNWGFNISGNTANSLLLIVVAALLGMVSCTDKKPEIEVSINEYHITCHPDSLQWLMEHPREDHYIPIEMLRDGKSVPAKMRVRGDTSRGFPKKSLKIKVENDDGTEETINLNAEYLDKSYMHQHVASAIFRLIDEPCFTTSYAPVHMNGVFYGLFVRIENVDENFLIRNGLDKNGNLYKASRDGASMTPEDDLNYHWEKKTNTRESWNDLSQLIADIDTCDNQSILPYVRKHFDYPSLVSHVAANIYLCNGSTYYHNYYLYHDAYGSGLWKMIAWDLDKTLSHYDWKSPFEMNNGADADNALLSRLFMNKTFLAEVEARLTEIHKLVIEGGITSHMQAIVPRLEPWVNMDTIDKIDSVSDWKAQVSKDISFIEQNGQKRVQALHDDLQPFQVCDLRKEPMLDPVFRWTGIPDFNSRGIQFRLFLSQDRTFEDSSKTIIRDLSDTIYTPESPLSPGRWYYKVVARQGGKYLTGYGRHYYADIETDARSVVWKGSAITLSADGSPYALKTDLFIPKGKSLILMPGARLYLDTGVSIHVEGDFVSRGTRDSRVYIRCASGHGAWKMIELNGCQKQTNISHTDLSNGRLVYHNCDVTLKHTVFRNFSADLNAIVSRPSLIWGENGNFVMDSCAMYGNQTGEGMNLHGGYPKVTNSFFTRIPDAIEFIEADSGLIAGNVVQYCKDDAIDMNACENVRVTRNFLLYNGDKAISVGVDHHGSSHRIVIEGNYMVGNRTGCDIKDSSDATIRNNVFYLQQTAVRARQKEPGYNKGGDATVESNILFASQGAELLKSEGNSSIYQSGNYANKKLDGATFIDSTLFFDLPETPFVPSAYVQLADLSGIENNFSMTVEESVITIRHSFPIPLDLSGCVVWDGHRGKIIPMGTIVQPGEPVVLYQGKKKNLPDNWRFGHYVRFGDMDEGVRIKISPGVIYNLTDQKGKWICKGSFE